MSDIDLKFEKILKKFSGDLKFEKSVKSQAERSYYRIYKTEDVTISLYIDDFCKDIVLDPILEHNAPNYGTKLPGFMMGNFWNYSYCGSKTAFSFLGYKEGTIKLNSRGKMIFDGFEDLTNLIKSDRKRRWERTLRNLSDRTS